MSDGHTLTLMILLTINLISVLLNNVVNSGPSPKWAIHTFRAISFIAAWLPWMFFMRVTMK